MASKTIEQVRDSRVWDLRDQGYEVNRVEVRPVGDKMIMSMTLERPISLDEDLHEEILKTIEPETPVETPSDKQDDDSTEGADPKEPVETEQSQDGQNGD